MGARWWFYKFLPIFVIFSLEIVQSAQSRQSKDEESSEPSGPPSVQPMSKQYVQSSKSKRVSSPGYSFMPNSYNRVGGGYYFADPYNYDDYYERPGRQFSARSASYSPMMTSPLSSPQVGFPQVPDSEYAATNGGHGGHGWGHGWGWGHEHGVSKVDNSSLGLLGLLGLLSLLSNVLMLVRTSSTTAAPAVAPVPGRKKRETNIVPTFAPESNEDAVVTICQKMLPSLNIIGHIHNGQLPLNCSHQQVCKANQILVKDLGAIEGRAVGSMLSSAIVKMFKEHGHKPKRKKTFSLLDKQLLEAGMEGRNGRDCETFYPFPHAACTLLLPQLISPQHVSAFVRGSPSPPATRQNLKS